MKLATTTFICALFSLTVLGGLQAGAPLQGSVAVPKGATDAQKIELSQLDIHAAAQAAVKDTAGKVTKAELDEEDGFLVWEMEVVSADGRITELKIDAGNGSVLRKK